VVQAQDTTCDPDGSLTQACSDASTECYAKCTDANDLSCYTDCGKEVNACAQDIVANCVDGVTDSCDPDGSSTLACVTTQNSCNAACVESNPSNPDCFTTCVEDFQKCSDEVINNCIGSGGNGNQDGGGGTDNNGGGDAPTSTSTQGSGTGTSDATIMNAGKAGLFLVPVFILLFGLW
jgi:hypothetical protein